MPGQLGVAWMKLTTATTRHQPSSHNVDHLEGFEMSYM